MGALEGIICADLFRRGEPFDKASFLAIDQRAGTTMPGASLALNEKKQIDEPSDMAYLIHNVLEPPPSDDLLPINMADRVVNNQAGLVRPINPRLLIVHDVSNFMIVWSGTVLFDMVTSRFERFHFAIWKD